MITLSKQSSFKNRWLIIPTATLMMFGAARAFSTKAPTNEIGVNEALVSQANQSLEPEALAKKSGCFQCHSIDKNIVGPAYHDVAERYKDDPKARAALIEKVKNGGKGNWTEVSHEAPMPPYSARLSAADIARLVDWVLSHRDTK